MLVMSFDGLRWEEGLEDIFRHQGERENRREKKKLKMMGCSLNEDMNLFVRNYMI